MIDRERLEDKNDFIHIHKQFQKNFKNGNCLMQNRFLLKNFEKSKSCHAHDMRKGRLINYPMALLGLPAPTKKFPYWLERHCV